MILDETPAQEHARKLLRAPGDPWDAVRYRQPDPEWPQEKKLAWYQVAFAQLSGFAYPEQVRRSILTAQECCGEKLTEETGSEYLSRIGLGAP